MEKGTGGIDSEAIVRAQANLDPKEDLSPYFGKCVALRDGYVVAHGADPEAVRNNPDVLPTDATLLVPHPGVQLLEVDQ